MLKVGERLQKERLRKGLTIEDVARSTKIRPEFLRALEEGEYKKLPSSAYIQGFLRNYTAFLGLPIKETIAVFKREFDEREYLGVLPDSFTKKGNTLSGFRLGPTTILLAVIILFVVGYMFYQYRAAVFSPMLAVLTPTENATVSSQTVTVSGKAEANATVTINDSPVYVDKDGNFRKDISVFSGQTTIVVKEQNSFNRETTIIRHITVQ
ncbi:MAG: helix-turn-helix domain-containing protein [Patescibacteria group bacterium]|nr:helix-turn-helix domain-containing protein [Patescibacteria group bacterium]